MKVILRFLMLSLLLIPTIALVAQGDKLQIVASHSILGDVVRNVIGDTADLTVTMPLGTDPHSFQAVPSDLTTLADADLVFINGAFFEEGLLEAIENAGSDMHIVTVSSCVDMIAFNDAHEDEEHPSADALTDTDDLSALCEQYHTELTGINDEQSLANFESLGQLYATDCDEGQCDPHVWMIPENVMLWTMLIRDTLIALDPVHTDEYAENASSYLLALDELAHDFIEPMIETVPNENRILVTSHDSLGYFAARYGFDVAITIIPGGSTLAEPSTSDIVAVIQLIQETGVSAIFTETTISDDLAQQISSETGAEIFVLYSGSLSDIDAPASTYLDYMRYNVTTIVEALGGGI